MNANPSIFNLNNKRVVKTTQHHLAKNRRSPNEKSFIIYSFMVGVAVNIAPSLQIHDAKLETEDA